MEILITCSMPECTGVDISLRELMGPFEDGTTQSTTVCPHFSLSHRECPAYRKPKHRYSRIVHDRTAYELR